LAGFSRAVQMASGVARAKMPDGVDYAAGLSRRGLGQRENSREPGLV
jgi:hypothetical protein